MKVTEKTEPEIDNFGKDLQRLFQANIRPDYDPALWTNDCGQIFNVEVDSAIWECNANILPQMLVSNEIIESTISEKIKELQDEQNKQSATKIEPKLDAYLCKENDKTFSDDANISHKQHLSPCKKYKMYAKNI